jgi:CrcB protein
MNIGFREFLLVFTGGGLGSIVRFGAGKFISARFTSLFPLGTLIVNVLACFLLGFIVTQADQKHLISPMTKLFLVTGFCGGFSTFSAFSNETVMLYTSGQNLLMILYVSLSILLSISGILAGQYISRLI